MTTEAGGAVDAREFDGVLYVRADHYTAALAAHGEALAAMRAQCEGLATLWDVEYERRGDEAVGYAVAADELRRALASGSAGGEANSG